MTFKEELEAFHARTDARVDRTAYELGVVYSTYRSWLKGNRKPIQLVQEMTLERLAAIEQRDSTLPRS